jgi:hypothetical protein
MPSLQSLILGYLHHVIAHLETLAYLGEGFFFVSVNADKAAKNRPLRVGKGL